MSPDGRGAMEAHCKLPSELLEAFPQPADDDARQLQEIAEANTLDKQ